MGGKIESQERVSIQAVATPGFSFWGGGGGVVRKVCEVGKEVLGTFSTYTQSKIRACLKQKTTPLFGRLDHFIPF
jgi:hypothetical protein